MEGHGLCHYHLISLKCLICGMPGESVGLEKNAIDGGKHYKIMAYRHLRNKDMPTTKAKNSLKTNWRPILTKMMQIPGLNVNHGFVQDDAMLKERYCSVELSPVQV